MHEVKIGKCGEHTHIRVIRTECGTTLIMGEGRPLHVPEGAPRAVDYHGEDVLEIPPGAESEFTTLGVCVPVPEETLGHWELITFRWEGGRWTSDLEDLWREESEARLRDELAYYADVRAGLYDDDEDAMTNTSYNFFDHISVAAELPPLDALEAIAPAASGPAPALYIDGYILDAVVWAGRVAQMVDYHPASAEIVREWARRWSDEALAQVRTEKSMEEDMLYDLLVRIGEDQAVEAGEAPGPRLYRENALRRKLLREAAGRRADLAGVRALLLARDDGGSEFRGCESLDSKGRIALLGEGLETPGFDIIEVMTGEARAPTWWEQVLAAK
jgi:hypothetical protein